MAYKRTKSEVQLTPAEKKRLLDDYLVFYQALARIDQANLNKKAPREAFATVIDAIGEMLLQKSTEMANVTSLYNASLKKPRFHQISRNCCQMNFGFFV